VAFQDLDNALFFSSIDNSINNPPLLALVEVWLIFQYESDILARLTLRVPRIKVISNYAVEDKSVGLAIEATLRRSRPQYGDVRYFVRSYFWREMSWFENWPLPKEPSYQIYYACAVFRRDKRDKLGFYTDGSAWLDHITSPAHLA
jgi:hypothetical protein